MNIAGIIGAAIALVLAVLFAVAAYFHQRKR